MRYEDLENKFRPIISRYDDGKYYSQGWVMCKGHKVTLDLMEYDTLDEAVEGIKKRIVDTAMAFEGNYLLRRGEQNTEE